MLQTFMGGFRTRPAAQESTKFRRTPEMVGRSHADPIGDAFRSFVGFLTTPLRQQFPQGSPRDIHRGAPADDPHNRQIVDQLGPQEQDLIGDAFEADTRSPARRWWESTEFPPVAIARGAWDTFVGQASPLDVALEAAGAGIATRGHRAPLAIGGARATPAPTTRGSESAIMKAFDESGDMPWEEYGTYGKDIVDNLLRDATITEAVEGTAGFSLADEAFRLADEALRDPDITNINTRRGNLNLPEGGSLMGGPTAPRGYTPEGGSLLDDALSRAGQSDDIPRIRSEDDLIEEAILQHDAGSSIEDIRTAYGDKVADVVEGEMQYRRDENPIDDAYLDAPEYLDDPGSPDAIEAAQERKIEEQLEAWRTQNEEPIQDAFDGLSKSELRKKYPDLDNRTLDEIMEYKRQEDEWDAMFGGEEEYLEELKRMEEEGVVPPGSADELMEDLFSDEALEGADEFLDLGEPTERTRIRLTGGGDEIDMAIANNPPIEEPPFEIPIQEQLNDLFPGGPSSFTENERGLINNYIDLVDKGDMDAQRAVDELREMLRPQAQNRLDAVFRRAVEEARATGEVLPDIIARELRRL